MVSKMSLIKNADDILTFVSVVNAGSFQAASDVLDISTSLVSKRISRLEAALGATLMHRSTRRLLLTEVGLQYFERVKLLPLMLESAKEQALSHSHVMQGEMRLVLPFGFDNSLKQHVLPDYVLEFPDVHFKIDVVKNPWDYISSAFDILVTGKMPHERFPDTSLVCRKLLNLPAGVFASVDYLKEHKRPRVPADLKKHRCLCFTGANAWPFLDKAGMTYDLQVRSAFSSNSSGLLQGMTEKGCGVCYGFDFMFQAGLADGSISRLLTKYVPPTLLETYVFYPKTDYLPVKTRVLIDRMLAMYAKYR
jgi:DNA-binding transcriptional LysR family regulator